ncbi:MAG: MFS transporter [Gammaproteobacteria bacterium]|nr:MFS transporter [Gammaproteobacteria bacterium]
MVPEIAPAARKLGPVLLSPGIGYGNAAASIYASLTSVSLLIYLGFVQPYILTEVLRIPLENQGSVTGRLASLQEVIVIVFMCFVGALSDQWGRRLVYVAGFVFIGAGYFLYPLADTIAQLTIFRMAFAVGAACIPVMLSAILIDYSQPASRGKWIGISNTVGSIGIMFMTLVMVRVPSWLEGRGLAGELAGRYTFWVASGLCFLAATILLVGLKGRRFDTGETKPNPFSTVLAGLKAVAGNRKLAFACGTAFVGRGDLVIFGAFIPLWATQLGLQAGLSTGEALGRAGILLFVHQITITLAAYVSGHFIDRFDKVRVLGVSFAMAAIGYFGIWLIADPFGIAIVGAIVILALGEVTITVAGNALVGEEAPDVSRGAVLGVFGVLGAIGIAVVTFVGGEIFDAVGRTAPFLMMVVFNSMIVVWAACLFVTQRALRRAGR